MQDSFSLRYAGVVIKKEYCFLLWRKQCRISFFCKELAHADPKGGGDFLDRLKRRHILALDHVKNGRMIDPGFLSQTPDRPFSTLQKIQDPLSCVHSLMLFHTVILLPTTMYLWLISLFIKNPSY